LSSSTILIVRFFKEWTLKRDFLIFADTNEIMKLLFASIVIAFTLSSCFTMQHVSGTGASKSIVVKKKQWFALWGLVPLNKVNAKAMAENSNNYIVKTGFSFGDIVIGVLMFPFSLEHQTITVIR